MDATHFVKTDKGRIHLSDGYRVMPFNMWYSLSKSDHKNLFGVDDKVSGRYYLPLEFLE